MSTAEELVQIITARFLKTGMTSQPAHTWARIAVEAIADALEERGMEIWDRGEARPTVTVQDTQGYL